MNYKDQVAEKLKLFKKEDISFTTHALVRMRQRQISEEEVVENLINPVRLQYAVKEEAQAAEEEKYACYFGYSPNLCHKYVIIITSSLLIVTVVKINRRWQIIAEKKIKR